MTPFPSNRDSKNECDLLMQMTAINNSASRTNHRTTRRKCFCDKWADEKVSRYLGEVQTEGLAQKELLILWEYAQQNALFSVHFQFSASYRSSTCEDISGLYFDRYWH